MMFISQHPPSSTRFITVTILYILKCCKFETNKQMSKYINKCRIHHMRSACKGNVARFFHWLKHLKLTITFFGLVHALATHSISSFLLEPTKGFPSH